MKFSDERLKRALLFEPKAQEVRDKRNDNGEYGAHKSDQQVRQEGLPHSRSMPGGRKSCGPITVRAKL
jgi:hypothetical protein